MNRKKFIVLLSKIICCIMLISILPISSVYAAQYNEPAVMSGWGFSNFGNNVEYADYTIKVGENGGVSGDAPYVHIVKNGRNSANTLEYVSVFQYVPMNVLKAGTTYNLTFEYKLISETSNPVITYFGQNFEIVSPSLTVNEAWTSYTKSITTGTTVAAPAGATATADIMLRFRVAEKAELWLSNMILTDPSNPSINLFINPNLIVDTLPVLPELINPSAVQSSTGVNISWSIPGIYGGKYLGVNIYNNRSQRLSKSTDARMGSCNFAGVDENAFYDYTVKAVDVLGNESVGVIVRKPNVTPTDIIQNINIADCTVDIGGDFTDPDLNVNLKIVSGTSEEVAVKTPEEIISDTIYTATSVTDLHGIYKFRYEFPESSKSGSYTAVLQWLGGKKQYSKGFSFSNPLELSNRFFDVNMKESIAEMRSVIEDSKVVFELDFELYDKLDDPLRNLVAQYIIEERNKLETRKYPDIATFISRFKEATTLQAINIAGSSDEIQNVLDFSDDIIHLNNNVSYNTYSDLLNATGKIKVLENMAKKNDYLTINDIQSNFSNETIFLAIYKAAGWDSIHPILTDNNSIINLDFTKYGQLVDKAAVDRQLSGCLFTTIDEIKTKFNDAVDAQKAVEDTPSTPVKSGTGTRTVTVSGGGGMRSTSTPTPSMVPEKVQTFDDLDTVPWAVEGIEALAKLKALDGRGNGVFAPNDSVTREEFLKMLLESFDLVVDDAEVDFDDVDAKAWYYKYVVSAKQFGISEGLGDGNFGVNKAITRQDLATMIYRVAKLKKINLQQKYMAEEFADSNSISSYAMESISELKSAGIINGMENNIFMPLNSATRAEVAKIVYGLIIAAGNN